MAERHERGLLDTSVVVDLEILSEGSLPIRSSVSAITLAELSVGVHFAKTAVERGVRLARLQATEATFEGLPFDSAAARHFGHLAALVLAAGQSPRPRRLDLMIAATALSHDLPLYTRNAKDLTALTGAVTILAV